MFFDNYLSIILACAFFGIVMLLARHWDQIGEKIQPTTVEPSAKPEPGAPRLPTVTKLGNNPPSAPAAAIPPSTPARTDPSSASAGANLPTVVRPGANPAGAPAGSIEPGRIQVVDGDTIRVDRQVYRLVGIDTPESGLLAKCAAERDLAARASRRLREIVASGSLRLDRVACACPPGTEGTQACDYGRLCGVLTTAGRDVGLILIGEGLAKRYNCSGTQCPAKQPWCL